MASNLLFQPIHLYKASSAQATRRCRARMHSARASRWLRRGPRPAGWRAWPFFVERGRRKEKKRVREEELGVRKTKKREGDDVDGASHSSFSLRCPPLHRNKEIVIVTALVSPWLSFEGREREREKENTEKSDKRSSLFFSLATQHLFLHPRLKASSPLLHFSSLSFYPREIERGNQKLSIHGERFCRLNLEREETEKREAKLRRSESRHFPPPFFPSHTSLSLSLPKTTTGQHPWPRGRRPGLRRRRLLRPRCGSWGLVFLLRSRRRKQ